jgi:hypothetical protein
MRKKITTSKVSLRWSLSPGMLFHIIRLMFTDVPPKSHWAEQQGVTFQSTNLHSHHCENHECHQNYVSSKFLSLDAICVIHRPWRIYRSSSVVCEVLPAVSMKSTVFSDVTPCSPVQLVSVPEGRTASRRASRPWETWRRITASDVTAATARFVLVAVLIARPRRQAVWCSETFTSFYWTVRRDIPDDGTSMVPCYDLQVKHPAVCSSFISSLQSNSLCFVAETFLTLNCLVIYNYVNGP